MATQLKHTDFTYTPTRPNIRVAFIKGEATAAVNYAMAKLPTNVRHATLDGLTDAHATPALPAWRNAVRDLRRVTAIADAVPSDDDAVFNAAWHEVVEAQKTMLMTPAPTLKELGEKVAFFFEIDAHEFDESAIGASITADVRRLLGKPVMDDHAWDGALATYAAVRAALSVRGLTDAAVDALAEEESAAMQAVLALPSTSMQHIAIKLRALTDVQAMVEDQDLAPVLADIERLVHGSPDPLADKALLDAYADRRRVFEEQPRPDKATPQEDDAYFARIDASEDVLLNTSATTVAGVLAKLRVAFLNQVGESWSDLATSDTAQPAFVDGLRMSDMHTRMGWSAIEDLARIGGVNLAEQGR